MKDHMKDKQIGNDYGNYTELDLLASIAIDPERWVYANLKDDSTIITKDGRQVVDRKCIVKGYPLAYQFVYDLETLYDMYNLDLGPCATNCTFGEWLNLCASASEEVTSLMGNILLASPVMKKRNSSVTSKSSHLWQLGLAQFVIYTFLKTEMVGQ